jgi:hypothetical protein
MSVTSSELSRAWVVIVGRGLGNRLRCIIGKDFSSQAFSLDTPSSLVSPEPGALAVRLRPAPLLPWATCIDTDVTVRLRNNGGDDTCFAGGAGDARFSCCISCVEVVLQLDAPSSLVSPEPGALAVRLRPAPLLPWATCIDTDVTVRLRNNGGDDVSVVYCKRKRNILWNVRVFRGIIKALKQQPRPI